MSNLPKDQNAESPKKKFGCLKTGLLVLVVLAIVVHFTLSGIAKNVANKQLPKQLQTEAEIGGLNLSLLLGRVGLRDLHIAQPEGFEGDELLKLDSLSIKVPPVKAAKRNPLELSKLHLQGLSLNLISDTNQVMNVTKLGPPPSEEPEVEEPEAETAEAAEPMPIWINEILLEKINVQFQDLAKEWDITVQDLRLKLENIQIDYNSGKGPGWVTANFIIPGGREDAKVKLMAKVAPISPSNPDRNPPMQLAMAIIGFDLGIVDPFLQPSPMAAKTAFGGSAFDFILFLEVGDGKDHTEQGINGHFELTTNRGTKLDDKLSGTFAEPVLPFTTLFADILGNQFGRVTKLGANAAKGGLEAGKAVAGTGVAAVKGAGKTVTGFAGGVFKSAKGVVTLDKDAALGGMKDATIGTAGNLTDTVKDTAGTAAEGVGNTAGAVTGNTQSDLWFTQIDERMETFEADATAWFEANPFPGSE
ncbi:AsmA family protein [Kiritimatiellaeota bacterium B1221]|nr:AsmA family protein [Kiritimatiellaeota bacterium B1221]